MTDPAITALLAPRSIAIIGVSQDFNKLNGRVMKFLVEKGYPGQIYPINPKYSDVGGWPCFPSIAAVAEEIDLAVIAVPARDVTAQIVACGRAGVRSAIVFSSGFGEMGAEGRALEDELIATARAAGLRLCGPNTLGLINAFEKVYATFTQYGMGQTLSGPVGFVSQSGAFGTAIAALARKRGMGLGYFINTGNERDVTFSDCMAHVLADPRVMVGAGYLEGVSDGAGFAQVAAQAMDAGKPLVMTKVGRLGAGAKAAASHTGALAGADAVFDGVARQFGVIRARNEESMLDIVDAFATTRPPEGPNIAIVTQSGGAGVLMSDRAEELGLTVAELSPATVARLRDVLPAFAATGNPVDVTAQFIADPGMLRESVCSVLADPGVDVAVIWLQLMEGFVDKLTQTFREIRDTVEKPFVVAWVAAPDAGLAALRDLGIACFRGADPAIEAVAAMTDWRAAQRAWAMDASARAALMADLPAPSLPCTGGVLPTMQAAAHLAALPLVPTRLARTADEAVTAAQDLGWPVVLKIESPDILHKTETGGVAVGLANETALRAAHAQIMANAASHAPDARISGVIVQATGRGSVELVLGVQDDPVFGPVVMVGFGGVLVEVLSDVVFAKAPVTQAQARAMLERLKGRALLDGVRGAAPVDRDALCALISEVSRFAAANAGRIATLDLNPVLAGSEGVIAVDWLLLTHSGPDQAGV
ncbi:acetate--CoA ligase family protein [Natronohydrobacter thiooxidans]|uniref:acetate--CoA ligase family protein n=1 Tax=Natronohydrobacter thiooxidans TaxID=87172 RepID=UPI0008FF0ACB|nr:acetate--CoA ligase family protein [Natronohydrobacter thiooxidans]